MFYSEKNPNKQENLVTVKEKRTKETQTLEKKCRTATAVALSYGASTIYSRLY